MRTPGVPKPTVFRQECLLTLVLAMALASCSSKSSTAANPTNFSDSDAKALITDYLNSWAREPLTVDMGEYAALEHNPFDPDPTLHKGQIWSETFKGFRSLEEAGI